MKKSILIIFYLAIHCSINGQTFIEEYSISALDSIAENYYYQEDLEKANYYWTRLYSCFYNNLYRLYS